MIYFLVYIVAVPLFLVIAILALPATRFHPVAVALTCGPMLALLSSTFLTKSEFDMLRALPIAVPLCSLGIFFIAWMFFAPPSEPETARSNDENPSRTDSTPPTTGSDPLGK